MATIQTEVARLGAAALRGLFKILSTVDFYLSIWMIMTAQGQSLPNLVLRPQGVEDVTPQLDFSQHCAVADAVKAFLCTRQGYTDAIGNVQKANFTLPVASNQRQQDNIILFSLVLVHHVHSDPLEVFGRHKFTQTVELACIGREDGNLLWFVVLQEKIAAESDYKHGLMFVLMAFSISDLFFQVVVFHEE